MASSHRGAGAPTSLLLIALLLLSAAAQPAMAAEYVIITNPTIITPELALDTAVGSSPVLSANRGGNGGGGSLRPTRKQPKLKAKVNVTESHNFGLLEDVEEEDLAHFKSVPGVLDIVLNVNISAAAVGVAETTSQWNLDRIDQQYGRDGHYTPAAETGAGVDLYIVDSGVNPHSAFGSRLKDGFSSVFSGSTGANDCNGHGTHVASTAAGEGFGVARKANIIPVQILNCAGQGSLMTMANGVSWVISNIQKTAGAKRSVVNLSIQALGNSAIDELVRQLHNAGAVVAVAAANYNTDACNYSPAREPLAVTVGASSQDDSKLPSSNFGRCVDIFAPGDDIIGAGIASETATTEKQGTSMASPLVAGVLATLRQKYPTYTNAQIIAQLDSISTTLTSTPVMDLDCGGQIPGVKLLQTISAAEAAAASSKQPTSFVAKGSELKSDFLNWAPQLETQAVDGEVCLTFSAQVDKLYNPARYGEEMAVLRLAVSTDVLPLGLTGFLTTSLSCRSLTPRYYVFENGPFYAQVTDHANRVVGTQQRHASAPSHEMSASVATDFYVTIKAGSDGTAIAFGRGDGATERTRDEIFAVKDANSKLSAGAYKYLSFSTPNQQDLRITNVRSCNGGVAGGSTTTPPPTTDGGNPSSGGDVAKPVKELEIESSETSRFALWPSTWAKKSSPSTAASCLTFSADMKIKGTFMVAMANQPLGVVKAGTFLGQPRDASMYEFQISRTNTRLFRDGKLLVNSKNKLTIATSARTIKFRASLANGKIRVEIWRNSKYMLLFSYTKDKTALDSGAGKRMALASGQPRTFTNIAVC